ncbi:hypothetical protein [Halovivax cerinus]|uniref:CARDB domain-containing protein n=1 Tax=Halovivax cerinus TaxID=1487865 RepID=A0ABD5NLN8_9EURY|nr:hypothetical protein [Halovivax cerinus]
MRNRTDDVDIAVTVYNETTDEVVIDETETVPANERLHFEFTVAYDEPGGSATVSVTLENTETGEKAGQETSLGPGSGLLGFGGTIDGEDGPSLSAYVE